MIDRIEPGRGIYDAVRAAALSGVPKSTLHYWARNEVLVPEIAPHPRTRLWSWGDLVVLRLIHWLRQDKPDMPRSPMADVRGLVQELRSSSFHWRDLHEMVAVSESGRVFIRLGNTDVVLAVNRQGHLPGTLALVRPYASGPDLLAPRKSVRIIPGKLSGEPHVVGSRITTSNLWALHREGYSVAQLQELYPDLSADSIAEAVEFEGQLSSVA